ncbi:MAG: hypothetical protein U0269_09080 [Polyangiales bacterium]
MRGEDGRWSATDLTLYERPRSELVGEVVSRRGALFVKVDREVSNTDWPLDTRGQNVEPGETVIATIRGQSLELKKRTGSGEDPSLARA